MSVITVSRQVGSLGTEVAQKVAEILQYEFIDKEKIGTALVHYGLPGPELEKFDEKKPPLWDSLQIQRKKFLHFIQAVRGDRPPEGARDFQTEGPPHVGWSHGSSVIEIPNSIWDW